MDVLESNSHYEYEEQNRKSLVNLKSCIWWLKPWSWHTFGGDRRDGRGHDYISLEVENDSLEKVMETLTPKGVFISLSDFSPLRA